MAEDEESKKAKEEQEEQEAQEREEELNDDAAGQGLDEHSMDIGDEEEGEEEDKDNNNRKKDKDDKDDKDDDKTEEESKAEQEEQEANKDELDDNINNAEEQKKAEEGNGNNSSDMNPDPDSPDAKGKENPDELSDKGEQGNGSAEKNSTGEGNADGQGADGSGADSMPEKGSQTTPQGSGSGAEAAETGAEAAEAETGAAEAGAGAAETAGATEAGAGAAGAAEAGAGAAAGAGVGSVALIVAIVILVILVVIGVAGFFLTMPQFLWNRLKQIALDIWNGFQGYIIGLDEAMVSNEDIIYVGQYLYDMGYDLVGMGFAESVIIAGQPAIISDQGISISKAIDPNEFDDLALLMTYKDGDVYEPTDEIQKNQIVALDAPFLRSYLVAENRTYIVNNFSANLEGAIVSFFDGSFFGEGVDAWGTGLLDFDLGMLESLGISRFINSLGAGTIGEIVNGIKVERESNQLRIRRFNFDWLNSHFDYTYFNLEGWTGRYGKPFELMLTLHVATMAPDLVKEFAMNKDLDAKVHIKLMNTTFNGHVYVDGKSIEELEAEGTYDEETEEFIPKYSESTIRALRDLENRASEIKTAVPYISSVTNHWFRNVYFEGTASQGASGNTDIGVDEDEDGIEDYNEATGVKTQKTRKLSADDNVYSAGTTTEEFTYTGDPIEGIDGTITFRGTIGRSIIQNKDAVRGVTNPTTKNLFANKYYIYDGTVQTAKTIQAARAKGDNSIKQEIKFTKESLQAFTILEGSESLDSQLIYRDLKELVIELGYFEREDFEEIEKEILEWPLPDFKRSSWPDRKYEKQIVEYGTLMLCEESVDKIKEQRATEGLDEAIDTARHSDDSRATYPSTSDSNSERADFTAETREIVDAHKNDFNVNNFRSKIASYGGYESYVKSLGGVFERYAGEDNIPNVTTAEELKAVSEYVFGLMTIWGFDYSNGDPGHYGKWGANNSSVASDGFYNGGTNGATDQCASPRESIDGRCSAENGLSNMTTNCNWTVDVVYYKAGIFSTEDTSKPRYSASVSDLMSHGGEVIPSIQDLQPGDIIECYDNAVPSQSDYTTWGDCGWYHVCYVGERDDVAGTITLYDGGHYFTNSGYYKNVIDINNPSWPLSGGGWGAIRVANISGDGLVGFPEDIDVIAMGDGVVKKLFDDSNNYYTLSALSQKIDGTTAEEEEVYYAASEQTLEGIAIKLSGDTLIKGYTLIIYGFDVDDSITVGQKLKADDVIGKTIKSNMCFVLLDRDRAVVEDIEKYIKIPKKENDSGGSQPYQAQSGDDIILANMMHHEGCTNTFQSSAYGSYSKDEADRINMTTGYVLINRALVNYGGHGTTIRDQLLAPGQYATSYVANSTAIECLSCYENAKLCLTYDCDYVKNPEGVAMTRDVLGQSGWDQCADHSVPGKNCFWWVDDNRNGIADVYGRGSWYDTFFCYIDQYRNYR